jgi:polyphosphate kinase 2 (PPK2 family)
MSTACTTTTMTIQLLDADGVPVDTWRENYPYDERMERDAYEEQKRLLQIELLKLQKWSQANGHATSSCSRAATPRARAAPSSGSWNT